MYLLGHIMEKVIVSQGFFFCSDDICLFLKYLTGMGLLPVSQYVSTLDLHWVNFSLVLIKCCSKFLFTRVGFDEKKANEKVRCLTEEVKKSHVSRN